MDKKKINVLLIFPIYKLQMIGMLRLKNKDRNNSKSKTKVRFRESEIQYL